MKKILASASPRRQALLKLILPDFTVCPAEMEEVVPAGMSVLDRPEYLAEQKADWVARRHPGDLVIGCDTAVILDDCMLGKPKDPQDAARMLRMLSGRTHLVITGCCLLLMRPEPQPWEKRRAFYEATRVTFRDLTEAEIAAYVATGEPSDKAGAYGIQGEGGRLVQQLQGDFYNVVGLPVARLQKELRQFFAEIPAPWAEQEPGKEG